MTSKWIWGWERWGWNRSGWGEGRMLTQGWVGLAVAPLPDSMLCFRLAEAWVAPLQRQGFPPGKGTRCNGSYFCTAAAAGAGQLMFGLPVLLLRNARLSTNVICYLYYQTSNDWLPRKSENVWFLTKTLERGDHEVMGKMFYNWEVVEAVNSQNWHWQS